MAAAIESTTSEAETYPNSELDSHANMVVLGKDCFVFEWSGLTCNVKPFSETLGKVTHVPIVDAAIAYECPYTYEVYILMIRNALYIPTLKHNLIPPFIMHEGGVIVNEVAKIHSLEPSSDDHCIKFKNNDLVIPLKLNGTFSYFHSRMPTSEELYSCDKISITPDGSHWNPYCESFSLNEESMLDHEGNIANPSRHTHNVMDIDDDDDGVVASVQITDYENEIDSIMEHSFHTVSLPHEELTEDDMFATAINGRAEISKVMGSIGSTREFD